MSTPDGEQSGERRRLTFDVPAAHLPELMAILGDFALGHDFTVTFGEFAETATEIQPRYDPKLTVLAYDQRDQEVALIAEGNLKAFAKDADGHTGRGERAANSIFAERALQKGILPYVLAVEGTILGLRANRLTELVAALDRGVIRLPNLGPKTIELLREYQVALAEWSAKNA